MASPAPAPAASSSAPSASSSAPVSNGTPAHDYRGRLIKADSVSKPFDEALIAAISAARSSSSAFGKEFRPLKLVGILATRAAPSIAYAKWSKKACEAVGIEFEIRRTYSDDAEGAEGDAALDPNTGNDVEELIIEANEDDTVDGMMVYFPIFGGRQDGYLQQIVSPLKDVEGLNFIYMFNLYHNIRYVDPRTLAGTGGMGASAAALSSSPRHLSDPASSVSPASSDANAIPEGFVKSILPCTPLAIVKCLEHLGVYNSKLPFGDRLYGRVVTVINRSEVVGRPLAALLANDGARVFSVDLDGIQEFNKRPTTAPSNLARRGSRIATSDRQTQSGLSASKESGSAPVSRFYPHHQVTPCTLSLAECLGRSDVVISGVPSKEYKVNTEDIKQGAMCINFSSEKNFEADVRDKASMYIGAIGKVTVAMLQRNLLRLRCYREQIVASNFGDSQSVAAAQAIAQAAAMVEGVRLG